MQVVYLKPVMMPIIEHSAKIEVTVMSRKTHGKGMSRGMSPEFLDKEVAGEKRPGESTFKPKQPNLKLVPGLPRPVHRRSPKA